MSIFRILAETLSDKNFFDVKEFEETIETYFKLWLSDIRTDELMTDDIVRERNRILSEQYQLTLQRNIVEKKLFDAKERIKDGFEVDKYWMSRANLAFRTIKWKIVRCQDQLGNLKTIEKKRNTEKTNIEDRVQRVELYHILKDRFGEDYTKQLFNEAHEKTKQEIINPTR